MSEQVVKVNTRIATVLGTKGGVGKTDFTCHLTNWARAFGLKPMLMDMDSTNWSFHRFFPEAEKVDVRKFREIDRLIAKISEEYPLIIADQRAGSDDEMFNWFRDVPFDELDELGVRFTGFGVVTSDPDSVNILLQWVEELGNRIDYVLVKNLKDGDDIVALERTAEGIDFLKRFRPAVITVPKMADTIKAELNARNMTIEHVVNSKKPVGELTSLMMRSRLKRYQRELFDEINNAQDSTGVILP